MPLLSFERPVYRSTPYFESLKQNAEFKAYVHDILDYGTYRFESLYIQDDPDIVGGFVRYGRYSRKDVSRILNYDTNREGTLNGYQIVGHTCPIFVTYEKCDDISANTKYEDRFVSPQEFSWMTRARVRLTSSQIPAIQDSRTRKLLFVKKSDAEGSNFYYIGDLKVLGDPVETTIANDAGVQLPIVNFRFIMTSLSKRNSTPIFVNNLSFAEHVMNRPSWHVSPYLGPFWGSGTIEPGTACFQNQKLYGAIVVHCPEMW